MICAATRVDGEACKGQAMEGSDRCSFHQGVHVGAASTLTPELADKLVALLHAGNYIGVAVRAVGVSRALFYQWLERGKSDALDDAPFRELRDRVELARAEAEARNVAHIASAARESWQAAAWLLERQYPDRWGRVSVRMREDVPAEDAAPVVDDPFAEVDQLAERRAQRQG